MSREKFRQQLTEGFDLEEFQTLCFDLGIDYDSLPGAGKAAKVRDLIGVVQRKQRVDELLAYLARHRPRIDWLSLNPAADQDSARQSDWLQDNTVVFVGQTEWGPFQPLLINSWQEYLHYFGAPLDPAVSFLGYAVRGFFANGGRRAYIARVLGEGAALAAAALPATDGNSRVIFTATSPGTWGNDISIQIRDGTRTGLRLTITLSRSPSSPVLRQSQPAAGNPPPLQEDFDNLRIDLDGPNFIGTVLQEKSRLVQIEWEGALAPPQKGAVRLAGGADGQATVDRYAGDPEAPTARRMGLAALFDLEEMALLCVPDHAHPSFSAADRQRLLLESIACCEKRKDCFAIVSTAGENAAVDALPPPPDTAFAATYYPWLRVSHAYQENLTFWLPPTGHVAGAYARHDLEKGVHQSPAGLTLRGLAPSAAARPQVAFPVSLDEEDLLLRKGINTLREQTPREGRIWMTTAVTCSIDAALQHIGLRRFAFFLAKSIILGLKWVQFEENDGKLWAEVRNNIAEFLHTLWELGALQGEAAAEAFFVRCDETTMTPDDIDNGRLVCLLAAMPTDAPGGIMLSILVNTQGNGTPHVTYHYQPH